MCSVAHESTYKILTSPPNRGIFSLPAMGGPIAVDTPRASVRSPNAFVNFSRPSRSQIMIEVSEMYAAENMIKFLLKRIRIQTQTLRTV